MSVILYSNDLFFGSRVRGYAERVGQEFKTLNDERDLDQQLDADTRLVMIDLSTAGNVEAIVSAVRAASPTARLIAYGPHVQAALLEAAQAAGCDVVMTKGQFDQALPTLIHE